MTRSLWVSPNNNWSIPLPVKEAQESTHGTLSSICTNKRQYPNNYTQLKSGCPLCFLGPFSPRGEHCTHLSKIQNFPHVAVERAAVANTSANCL